jgi:hypothetical protein
MIACSLHTSTWLGQQHVCVNFNCPLINISIFQILLNSLILVLARVHLRLNGWNRWINTSSRKSGVMIEYYHHQRWYLRWDWWSRVDYHHRRW